MGTMEQHFGKPMATTLLHQHRDIWKTPRGIVVRIEALTLVAITLSFFLATFGSCRRWSNRWVIQKGFLVANALFLSLGTYSIGLMQSSPVKSEMYPIWAVSLLSLLCCVDSITAYSLEFKSQLWKMVYQLCLYCGYVLLMSISTKSSGVGNIAVGVLSTITLMKGFHRTQALVVPGRMRSMIRAAPHRWERKIRRESAESVTKSILVVHLSLDHQEARPMIPGQDEKPKHSHGDVTLLQINSRPEASEEAKEPGVNVVEACKDVCLALSLSHVLQRRLLGRNERILEVRTQDNELVSSWIVLRRDDGAVDYERALKVVELELAFLYDIQFTSNAFLHYYQAKTASVWAVASIIGVMFVGVAAIAIPARTTRQQAGALETTTGDLIVTGVVVVSLGLLQVLQVLRCWTSNWARVAFACDYVRNNQGIGGWQMRLRASLTRRSHWFHSYLWQNKIGQLSLVESVSKRRECNNKLYRKFKGWVSQGYSPLSRMLGLVYFEQMLHELLGSSHKGASVVELHADVKAAIADFLRETIKSDRARPWSRTTEVPIRQLDFGRHKIIDPEGYLDDKTYTRLILVWHIATCYCELAQQRDKQEAATAVVEKNHRVASLVSRYCAHLVASVPRLLPGQPMDTKDAYKVVSKKVGELVGGAKDRLASMERAIEMEVLCNVEDELCALEKKRATSGEWLREAKDALGALGGEEAEAGIEALERVLEKLCGAQLMLSMHQSSRLERLLDELGAVERGMERQKQALLAKSASSVADYMMEKEREAVRQANHELRGIEWPMKTEGHALHELGVYLAAKGEEAASLGWRWEWEESSQRLLLATVEEEMERVTQAVHGARDKLSQVIKEWERRGIRRSPEKRNASFGDIIWWSALDLGDRLQRLPAPERWKLLVEFWVKALVYAAASDCVEEHMQQLAQGGEFITHLWALLSHHGILSWRQEENDPFYSWPVDEERGT
ncbi:hypothetical protein HU200_027843 [Digitaria exilis]|uniref:DUF4220 domain-containing protein n=1 Tax=Digitaria exilis TaxID=1010633 RepID=A0A835EQL4_9POAL|nr:hypothetical protein HU200_027843 [Digitaria exilis]